MEKLVFRPKTGQGVGKDIRAARAHAREVMDIILDEEIRALESHLAGWVGSSHCIAVSDAASGIALALKAVGVRKGERVIAAGLGCALPVQGILLAGALPVFADINPNTYTIDPFCVEYALGKIKRNGQPFPRALIASDLFGAPCHFAELEQLCNRYGIALIEDLSGALGSKYKGKHTGNFGRFSVTSFACPWPLMDMGGGAVFCRDEGDSAKIAALRRGSRQQRIEPESRAPYINSADASLTRTRLDSLGEDHTRKEKVIARYRENLMGKMRMQQVLPGSESIYSQLIVALPKAESRASVISRLLKSNIPSGPPLCGQQTADSDWNRTMLANTHALAGRLLSMPIHPYLSGQVVDFICESLLESV